MANVTVKEEENLDPARGKLNKVIQFKETVHRHVEVLIRLKHDGLSMSKFLRACITLYIEKDPMFENVLDRIKESYGTFQSKENNKIAKKLVEEGEMLKRNYLINDKQIEDIFDRIEQEFPDL